MGKEVFVFEREKEFESLWGRRDGGGCLSDLLGFEGLREENAIDGEMH